MKHKNLEKNQFFTENQGILDQFSLGFVLGILIGEGHFGGDGKQPQITLRMHVRHEMVFRWLVHLVPGSKLYGPYEHDGRRYYQWMARGEALKNLVPLIEKTTLARKFLYLQFRVTQFLLAKLQEKPSFPLPKSLALLFLD